MRRINLRGIIGAALLLQLIPTGLASAASGYGTTYVASVSSSNILINNSSAGSPRISRNGSAVVYTSSNDGSTPYNIYYKNLSSGALSLMNIRPDGHTEDAGGASISDDGRYISFTSENLDSHQGAGVYLRDLQTNSTQMLSVGVDGNGLNTSSGWTSISGDGRYVVTSTASPNLISQTEYDYCSPVPPVPYYRCGWNVFLFDSLLNTTTRITSNPDGTPFGGSSSNRAIQPVISQNGQYVVYGSDNFGGNIQTYLWNRMTNETSEVCSSDNGLSICTYEYAVTNQGDVYYAKAAQSNGLPGIPSEQKIYKWDRIADSSQLVTDTNGNALPGEYAMDSTPDGSQLAFVKIGTGGDPHTYLFDTTTLAIKEVSISSSGQEGGAASQPSVSADGNKVAFYAVNKGLVPGVSDEHGQIFIHDAADFTQPPTPIVDQTPPALGDFTWTSNPLVRGNNATVSLPITETVSGITRVEYFLNNQDPGRGNAIPMTLVNGKWIATFGADLPANTYIVNVRAEDGAGNWGFATDILAIYDPSAGYVTGHANIAPSSGDTLPISARGSKDMKLGFTNVKYAGTTTTQPSGSIDLVYTVKNNDDAFSLSSTSLDWLVVNDPTHASIQGTADLTTYVNKAKTVSSNPFRIDMVLGTSGSPDHYAIKIFAAGANPATATPLYVIDDYANSSSVRIQ